MGDGAAEGMKEIFIRTEVPNAVWFDASIQRAADGLGLLGDPDPVDVRRGRAVGILAQPQRALDLFTQAAAADRADREADGSDGEEEPPSRPAPATAHTAAVDPRPPATLYIHLTDHALTDGGGVARLEGHGPISIQQAQAWLGHCAVTVKPVIDLANQAPVDAYEIPDRLREAIHLRNPIDVFPYATNAGRRKQIDHSISYVPLDDGGPPGQTGMHNLGPMIGFNHRIKTHRHWQVRQPFDGVFVWRSPCGRYYLVDHTGTHKAIPAA